ncbi:MAG TPA: ester cyclase [Candidatus Acidoferrales bacterium]|nr:ester cyclase [Candidatus Acidoferrales bacterium]
MSTNEANRRTAEEFHRALNDGDLDAAVNCFSEGCQNHGRRVGRAGLLMVLREIKTVFPDVRLTVLNSVAEGEWVVVRCTYRGTHRGMGRLPVDGGLLVGVQPTEHSFEVQHIHMYRILDGKIAEHYANRDDVGMARQLGVLPPVPAAPGS